MAVAAIVAVEEHPVAGSPFALNVRSCVGAWRLRRYFDAAHLNAIQQLIVQGETTHRGQVVFAVEGALPLTVGSSRERALEVFGRQQVWNTKDHTGVLLYVVLAERRIEIIADRGTGVADNVWQGICASLQQALAQGQFVSGVQAAVASIHTALSHHCPRLPGEESANELPDAPVKL